MDFYDFKSHADLGSIKGEGSNTWGWVSDTGREFIAVGQVSTPISDADLRHCASHTVMPYHFV